MGRKSFTEHLGFMQAGQAANAGLHQALVEMGLDEKALFRADLEDTASRIVDDLTKLLLRASDFKQKRDQIVNNITPAA